MNVAGWLTMLVFGVGYQLLPRLFGHPLYSPRLATLHLYFANVGLGGLVLGFLLGPAAAIDSRWFTVGGGALYAAGALLWVWNLWKTFNAADARAKGRPQSGRSSLPTVEP
jgi:cbb3-type cytochrome oxidase subunit 1